MFSFSTPKKSHPIIFEIQKLYENPGDIDEDEIRTLLGKLRDDDEYAFSRLMQLEPSLQPIADTLPRIPSTGVQSPRSVSARTPSTPQMQMSGYLSVGADGAMIASPNRLASFGSLLSLHDTTDDGLHIEEVFEHFDKSGKGSINRDQFIAGFRELRRKKMAKKGSVSKAYRGKRKSVDLQAWVSAHQGTHVINRLLIANNGLAAVKAIMSIREWAQDNFQQSHIISIVCMATKEDIKSNSEYIRMSDELIEVPGGTNSNNYANVQVIITTALRAHCDAVWAGWGHASENPELPRALLENGLIWLGPGAEAMETLGDKIRSTLIAQNVGVQVFSWSGDGIKGWGQTEFAEACVTTSQQAAKAAERIGFPVMIKASEGGGGKGIRKCTELSQVNAAFRQVSTEVPGSPIFIMKLGSNVRHVEVQLVADNYGNTIAIYGRDCSIQRRHQKIIEEGPALSKDPKTMQAMMTAAIALAQQVGYVGLGTVEYLYFNDGTYCFLELNPRLQVEHGVSELLSGLNLPACQVMIAMGIPLYRIKEIRALFGEDPSGTDPIDFANTPMVPTKNFVIACRITAENAANGFQPTTGKVDELILRPRAQTFGYFSMKPGSSVHEFADSQFGHIFAVGKTREIARVRMLNTLRHLDIRGEISTNVEFHQFVLETPDFKKNRITTEWLESLSWKKDVKTQVVILLGCAVSAHQAFVQEREVAVEDVKRGRSLIGHSMEKLAIADVSLIWKGMKYTFIAERVSELQYVLRLQSDNANGWNAAIEIRSLSDGGFLISIDSHTYVVYRNFKTTGLQVRINGVEYCFDNEYDPSVLKSDMAGKMVKLLKKNGDHVIKNEAYAEIEVMKMILQLKAPEDGTIELKVFEGSVLEPGTLIAHLDLDDPDKIKRTETFRGGFDAVGLPHAPTNKPQELFFNSMKAVHDMMSGYTFTKDGKEIMQCIETMVNCLRDPMMPAHEFVDALESMKDRIPDSLYKKLTVVGQDYISVAVRRTKSSLFPWEKPAVFPVNEVRAAIDAHTDLLDAEESLEFEKIVLPIREMLMKWHGGAGSYLKNQFLQLLGDFYDCEKYFCGVSTEESMSRLMADFDDTEKIVDYLFAHYRLEYRVPLVLEILGTVANIFEERLLQYNQQISPMLEKLMLLTDTPYAQVHIKTRSIKMQKSVATKYERWMSLEHAIRNKNMDSANTELANLFEFFPGFMADSDQTLSRNAVEIFLVQMWRRHTVQGLTFIKHEDHALIDTTIQYQLIPKKCNKYAQPAEEISGTLAISYDIAACLNNMENIIHSLEGDNLKTLFFLIYLEPPKRIPNDENALLSFKPF
jgi:acetyl-CoA carboxylase/biotin carboxylase 1